MRRRPWVRDSPGTCVMFGVRRYYPVFYYALAGPRGWRCVDRGGVFRYRLSMEDDADPLEIVDAELLPAVVPMGLIL